MSTEFFNSECGGNILALAFRAHGKLERAISRTSNLETTSTTAGGAAYLFNNHLHPCASDRNYNVFGSDGRR
jgi:hypothetical protein